MAKKNLRQFEYERVATLETDMWRAYYEHRFSRLFVLLIKLVRTQFDFGWLLSVKIAFYAAVAAADYRLRYKHEDFPRVERKLVRFYKAISDNVVEPFDYRKAAKIELEWWNIHRYPDKYKKTLADSLAEGAAVIYNGKPADFREYAQFRADGMTLRDNTRKAPAWKKIEIMLKDSWRSLHQTVQKTP